MGVAGLWPLLAPAQSVTTLTALSLTKFDTPCRAFRIGIDASIWFFHAEYGKEGENPELRTLFFRCAQLLSQGFLPLFIFDGPLRPDIKRGKRINKSANKLVTGMKAMIEAFGFEWRTAPGEAEAELAFLNRIGIIDGILSDDVDNFLFGAHTVIRNHSSTHAGAKSVIEKAKVITYTLPHPELDFGREDFIFIALCSGGDYGTGLANCGIKIAAGLARAGFGKSLYRAAITHYEDPVALNTFVQQWKVQLAQELRTNASTFLPRKSPKLANSIPESFPDLNVLRAYSNPITSESKGRSDYYDDLLVINGKNGWLKKDPGLDQLAEKCEFYFEWGFMESIIKRFRTVIFHGVTLRIMRRVILQNSDSGAKTTRMHESTSKTLEYRVEINPAILVQLTACGVKGIRRPDDNDEWAEFEDDYNEQDASSEGEGEAKAKPKKEYADPALPLKLWLSAVLVRGAIPGAVEAYDEVVRRKEEKKAGKGKKTKTTDEAPKAKAVRKPKAKAGPPSQDAGYAWTISTVPKGVRTSEGSSDEDIDYKDLFKRPISKLPVPKRDTGWVSVDESSDALFNWPSTSKARPSSPLKPKLSDKSLSLFQTSEASTSSATRHKSLSVSKPSPRDKGKQKASIPRSDSLLSLIDAINTPKKQGKKARLRDETSSPEKPPFNPFPMSLEDSPTEGSDLEDHDPFPASPLPPGPPQTPSPQKRSRQVNPINSDSSASDGDSPQKEREQLLNKSSRKSKEHTYPKDPGDRARKTIRDIQHPSRVARAASPTPLRRTPVKSAPAVAKSHPVRNLPERQQRVQSTSAPKGPIIISDSDSEDDEPPISAPRFPQPPGNPSRPMPRPKVKTTRPLAGSSKDLDRDEDDIPPLLRARARVKADQAVEVIELSDSD
ncbi:hypothetical protein BDP27DRAFT_1312041 [Rhodocollybia butyracea]|uniref:XPG-I domain-containing protein n=1 Tax=Rhodocollybia butyracea TaxID=206335 RepID=A0A9P5Q339_9AGAR|nr:hypothetical protein BDP27DRAFT_1312041 [Rhodocollybia butyracea]